MRIRALILLIAFTAILPAATYGQIGNMLRNKMGKVINAGARTANKEVDNQIDSAATKETQKAIDREKEKAVAREDSISQANASQSAKSDGAPNLR